MNNIFLISLITENVVLTKCLGITSFMNKEKDVVYTSILLIITSIISTMITYLINKYVLLPINVTYLSTIIFIITIFLVIKITELIIKKYFKNLYKTFKTYIPYITIISIVFSTLYTNIKLEYTFINSIINALGTSLGFTLTLYIFILLKDKITKIKSFKGITITLITIGIISLIFKRLGG